MYSLNIPITAGQLSDVMDNDALLDQLVGTIAYAPKRYLAEHVELDG